MRHIATYWVSQQMVYSNKLWMPAYLLYLLSREPLHTGEIYTFRLCCRIVRFRGLFFLVRK